ncbi:MAG: hypothetical protein EAZ92_12955 [Candidatus Kapaibacterium sp.]|nr:MAG: hypothetical protein EAZ92_12955 [Candidatus Kapabacteria bacterium]
MQIYAKFRNCTIEITIRKCAHEVLPKAVESAIFAAAAVKIKKYYTVRTFAKCAFEAHRQECLCHQSQYLSVFVVAQAFLPVRLANVLTLI